MGAPCYVWCCCCTLDTSACIFTHLADGMIAVSQKSKTRLSSDPSAVAVVTRSTITTNESVRMNICVPFFLMCSQFEWDQLWYEDSEIMSSFFTSSLFHLSKETLSPDCLTTKTRPQLFSSLNNEHDDRAFSCLCQVSHSCFTCTSSLTSHLAQFTHLCETNKMSK